MKNICIFILMAFPFPARSQHIISGKIIDKHNGESLQYAVISQSGSRVSVTRDRDG